MTLTFHPQLLGHFFFKPKNKKRRKVCLIHNMERGQGLAHSELFPKSKCIYGYGFAQWVFAEKWRCGRVQSATSVGFWRFACFLHADLTVSGAGKSVKVADPPLGQTMRNKGKHPTFPLIHTDRSPTSGVNRTIMSWRWGFVSFNGLNTIRCSTGITAWFSCSPDTCQLYLKTLSEHYYFSHFK